MIIVFDSKIEKPIVIITKGNLSLDDIGGNTIMKVGESDEILKLPKGYMVTDIKDGALTIDIDTNGEQAPLHYWKLNE